jgi:aryl-alcohol dehydrogenase-like predicted oxidoreductase
MRQMTLPGTDLAVSSLCLGAGPIGSTLDRGDSCRLLDAFVDQGGNFVDTALVYANWLPIEKSISEKTLGRWMRERGNRKRMVVGTKGAHPDLAAMHVPRLSPAEIRADAEASLRHLQSDWIDLYWLHRDDPARPVGEIVEALNALMREGKIRAAGCSNWRAPRIREAQGYAAARGLRGFAADQMMWSAAVIDASALADQTLVVMDDALHQLHAGTGLAAVPYSSQAGGLFQKMASGRWMPRQDGGVYPAEPNQARYARIQEVAARRGLTVSQVALGCLLSQPFITVPIVGCRTLEQLRDSVSAADVRLSSEDLDDVRSAG